MNFDRNVSCFIAVYALMDNDFFNQAVKGGGVQFRDVGVFLNGFYPLAGVIRKPDFIGQLLPAFLNSCFQLGLFLLRLFHQQIEVRFADTSGNHVLIQPQNHLFQNVNAFHVFGKGALQRFPLAFLLGFAGVGQLPGNGFPVHQGGSGALPDFVQHKAVKGVVLNPMLGTVLLAVGVVGFTGINLLRVLVVGVADRQRLPALAALDKPRKQADFPGLAGALPGFQLALHDVKGLAVNKRLMLVLHHNPFLRLLLPDGADFEAVFLLLGSDSAGVDGVHQDVLNHGEVPDIPPVYRVFLFPLG